MSTSTFDSADEEEDEGAGGVGGGGIVSPLDVSPASHDIPLPLPLPPSAFPPTQPAQRVRIRKTKTNRKQLVSCDSCRLRRVKCNKLELHPDVPCAPCQKKGVKCTTEYVKTKPKAVRSGKLIQQAKMLYGDADINNLPLPPGPSSGSNYQEIIMPPGQARLVNSELTLVLTDHLVEVYRTVVHPQFNLMDLQSFNYEYERASKRSDGMTPVGQCALALAVAWGARFADHPSVIRTGSTLTELQNGNGQSFASTGDLREQYCAPLLDRALRVVDETGSMRKPDFLGCGALGMMELLSRWGRTEKEGRTYLNASIHNLRDLYEHFSTFSEEDELQRRRMSGTLFWLTWTRDAVTAALSGRRFIMAEEDARNMSDVVCHIREEGDCTMEEVTVKDPGRLAGRAVVALYLQLIDVMRLYVDKIGDPLSRRNPLDLSYVHRVWAGMLESVRCVESFKQAILEVDWSTPPNWTAWVRDISSLRLQLAYALHLQIQRRIAREREELEKAGFEGGRSEHLHVLMKAGKYTELRFLPLIRAFVRQLVRFFLASS
ncbi:hypothetical protein T439DRAFT_145979 [Meredithblackwellia eburnea MCA 4105]